MDASSVEAYVVTLIKTLLPGNAGRTITRDMDLVTDLNADSMSLVSIILSLDEKFGIGTDELGALVQECRTVGDLVDVTERLRSEQGAR
jgi:acyl carrier protein